MAVNHEYEVVEKDVVFSVGVPVTPFKLFTVTGDVLAFIVPAIKDDFDSNATFTIGEQNGSTFWSMETQKVEIASVDHKVVSSDLYMSSIMAVGTIAPTTGTIRFYCIFAQLSFESGVEAAL